MGRALLPLATVRGQQPAPDPAQTAAAVRNKDGGRTSPLRDLALAAAARDRLPFVHAFFCLKRESDLFFLTRDLGFFFFWRLAGILAGLRIVAAAKPSLGHHAAAQLVLVARLSSVNILSFLHSSWPLSTLSASQKKKKKKNKGRH